MGLKGKRSLNGTEGVLGKYLQKVDRWSFDASSVEGSLSVKPNNLEVIRPGSGKAGLRAKFLHAAQQCGHDAPMVNELVFRKLYDEACSSETGAGAVLEKVAEDPRTLQEACRRMSA